MAEHKAKIVFAPKVWEKIDWFTYNFKTEIGALGKVKQKIDAVTKEKYFYVYDLLFPQQHVTGATVHFTAGMWGDLLKEHGLNGLKDIAFYWHRHPGGSAHSGTDDVDTFETFMSKEANRKYFIFLQTAVNTAGWNDEARIDIRLPVRHTILAANIDITVEETEKETAIRDECEAIAKKVIVTPPTPTPSKSTYVNDKTREVYRNGQWVKVEGYHTQKDFSSPKKQFSWDKFSSAVQSDGGHIDLDEAVEKGRFGQFEGTDFMDNDLLNGQATAQEEKVSIKFKNGQATIIAGKFYGQILEKVLKNKEDGKLNKFVREHKVEASGTDGMKRYNLQPVKKMYQEMKNFLTRSFFTYNDALLSRMEAEEDQQTLDMTITNLEGETEIEAMADASFPAGTTDFLEITGQENITDVLGQLEEECSVTWDNMYSATVYDSDYAINLGQLFFTEEEDKIWIKGLKLVGVVEDIQYTLDDEEQEEEEDAKEEEE